MKKALLGTLVVLLVALLSLRLALPFVVKNKLNASLASLDGYEGSVEKVGLSLFLGRITLKKLVIRDTKGDFRLTVPFLRTDVAWGPLLKKTVVVSVLAREPLIRMVAPKPVEAVGKVNEKARKVKENVERKTGKTIGQLLESLMPFELSRFEVEEGLVLVHEGKVDAEDEGEEADDEQKPRGPLRLSGVSIVVEGLTNMSEEMPAELKARASLAGGSMSTTARLKPMKDAPTFDLNAEVKGVDLAKLSPMLRWQWNVDVERGQFELVAEAKAEKGGFKGYAKPFIKDLKVAPAKGEGPIKKLKQAVVGVVAKVLENNKTKEIATKVPFEGKFEDPKTGVWDAVIAVLRNAFIEALSPTFDKI